MMPNDPSSSGGLVGEGAPHRLGASKRIFAGDDLSVVGEIAAVPIRCFTGRHQRSGRPLAEGDSGRESAGPSGERVGKLIPMATQELLACVSGTWCWLTGTGFLVRQRGRLHRSDGRYSRDTERARATAAVRELLQRVCDDRNP
jgi:hypothetical protein